MRPRYYVGLRADPPVREVFRAAQTPTPASHGAQYGAVIGPFVTKRGADWMAQYGGHTNPHLTCVAEAERAARRHAKEPV